MAPTPEFWGLRSADGRTAQLLSVHIHGQLLGLMLRLTVQQTWRNVSGAPMAVRFSFPLHWNQCLLSLRALRHGQSMPIGRIERDSHQCCSTTLGILHTGDQVTLTWQVGQLMQLHGGSLRVQVPAALAPYSPYPFTLDFDIHDPVAQGTISSPSHDVHRIRHAKGQTLSLRAQHALDKDWVLTVHGLRDKGFAVASPSLEQPGHCTVLVSSHVRVRQQADEHSPLRMKLLLDHSSAMPPDCLRQIHTALAQQLAHLSCADQLALSRFGAQALHDLPRLQHCTEAYQRRLRALLRHANADLGPPQVQAALHAAMAIPDEDEEPVSEAAILLITASPLWAVDALLHPLRNMQHTLHVLTVGPCAEHSRWQELAQASAGMCESLQPDQQAEPLLARLLAHMRTQFKVHTDLTVTDAQVIDKSECPTRLSDGDTLHLWAQVQPQHPPLDQVGCPELQATLHWQRDDVRSTPMALTPVPVLWDESGDLARLCAAHDARRLHNDAARQTALDRHHLLWPDASRLAAQAPVTPPPSPAHAHTARPGPLPHASAAAPSSPSPNAPLAATASRALPSHPATPTGRLTAAPSTTGNASTLLALVERFNANASSYQLFRAALSITLRHSPTPFLTPWVLRWSRQAGNDPGRVWAVVLFWLHAEHDMALQTHALALVQQELAQMPVALRTEIHTALTAMAPLCALRHVA